MCALSRKLSAYEMCICLSVLCTIQLDTTAVTVYMAFQVYNEAIYLSISSPLNTILFVNRILKRNNERYNVKHPLENGEE